MSPPLPCPRWLYSTSCSSTEVFPNPTPPAITTPRFRLPLSEDSSWKEKTLSDQHTYKEQTPWNIYIGNTLNNEIISSLKFSICQNVKILSQVLVMLEMCTTVAIWHPKLFSLHVRACIRACRQSRTCSISLKIHSRPIKMGHSSWWGTSKLMGTRWIWGGRIGANRTVKNK